MNCAGCYDLTVKDTISNCEVDTTVCIVTVGTIDLVPVETIKIYPNPSKNHVIIDFIKSNIQSAKIKIFDMSGTLKFQVLKKENERILEINTKSLKAGVYIIKIEQESMISYKKLVIAR